MKDKLIKLLKSEINALTTEEIVSKLNLNTDEILEVQKILNDMVQKGEIYYTKKGKYILFENCRDLKMLIKKDLVSFLWKIKKIFILSENI